MFFLFLEMDNHYSVQTLGLVEFRAPEPAKVLLRSARTQGGVREIRKSFSLITEAFKVLSMALYYLNI